MLFLDVQLRLNIYFSFLSFLRDGRLFYTGPSQQYMRLVIMTEEEKRSALMECHDNLVTGKHNGVRSTRDRVIARYYWSTLIQDVKDWVIYLNMILDAKDEIN